MQQRQPRYSKLEQVKSEENQDHNKEKTKVPQQPQSIYDFNTQTLQLFKQFS
jgi:hypothetical protein